MDGGDRRWEPLVTVTKKKRTDRGYLSAAPDTVGVRLDADETPAAAPPPPRREAPRPPRREARASDDIEKLKRAMEAHAADLERIKQNALLRSKEAAGQRAMRSRTLAWTMAMLMFAVAVTLLFLAVLTPGTVPLVPVKNFFVGFSWVGLSPTLLLWPLTLFQECIPSPRSPLVPTVMAYALLSLVLFVFEFCLVVVEIVDFAKTGFDAFVFVGLFIALIGTGAGAVLAILVVTAQAELQRRYNQARGARECARFCGDYCGGTRGTRSLVRCCRGDPDDDDAEGDDDDGTDTAGM